MAKVFNYMVWDILTDKCLPGNYMATKEHIARIEGSFVIPNSGICQQRCRIILKKIIRLYPGSESLHGELSNA